ncbi:GNAT family N-acetyltransferase [Ralstonia soli]|uniref:GNAT family N-acetyltransferase n=1 Tax=Ralstonia soli TaxID=2953896 RepID=A0ABT1AKY0_9RALS|nr:GNAT family N-acetyltransferase [Ralstonia soli]MCO5399085.1 GNAT family N-acetyltransferase [Ralstonia soli]
MHMFVFKDRCGRVIRILSDDRWMCSVAHHGDEVVGQLRIDSDDSVNCHTAVKLTHLYVDPAYRCAGIAHTLLSSARRELGQPILIASKTLSDSPAWATLCRCLVLEGVLAAG